MQKVVRTLGGKTPNSIIMGKYDVIYIKRVCTAKLTFINCFLEVKDTTLNVLLLSGGRNINVSLNLLRGIIKYRWHLVGRMKGENFPTF